MRGCIYCGHTAKKNISECPQCHHDQFYQANRFGYITQVPAASGIPCQACEQPDRDLGFRVYRRAGGDADHVLPGYFCKSCRRKKFWSWQLRTLFTGWFGPSGFERNLGAIVGNAGAFFGPPVDMSNAGATTLETLNAQVKAQQQQAPASQEHGQAYADPAQATPDHGGGYDRPPAPMPAQPAMDLSWFTNLSRDDQKLIAGGQDFYAVLGLERTAGHQQVRKAYREMAKQHHPDSGGSEQMFKAVNEANYVLSDYQLRHAFDRIHELPPELRNF